VGVERNTTKFTVKFVYNILKGVEQREGVTMYEGFWRIKAQPSAHLTAWRVLEDKIVSKVNLVNGGITLESSICICVGRERKQRHIFFVSVG